MFEKESGLVAAYCWAITKSHSLSLVPTSLREKKWNSVYVFEYVGNVNEIIWTYTQFSEDIYKMKVDRTTCSTINQI